VASGWVIALLRLEDFNIATIGLAEPEGCIVPKSRRGGSILYICIYAGIYAGRSKVPYEGQNPRS
jgi:hypothetical protein